MTCDDSVAVGLKATEGRESGCQSLFTDARCCQRATVGPPKCCQFASREPQFLVELCCNCMVINLHFSEQESHGHACGLRLSATYTCVPARHHVQVSNDRLRRSVATMISSCEHYIMFLLSFGTDDEACRTENFDWSLSTLIRFDVEEYFPSA